MPAPWRGAFVGLVATLFALGGFYLLSTLVENLGGHGFLVICGSSSRVIVPTSKVVSSPARSSAR